MSTEAWIDKQGDVWRLGDDGLMHTPETAAFPPEYVERKWGPLRPVRHLTDDEGHPMTTPADHMTIAEIIHDFATRQGDLTDRWVREDLAAILEQRMVVEAVALRAGLMRHTIYGFNGIEIACQCSRQTWRAQANHVDHVADALAKFLADHTRTTETEGAS